jgi:hypothetical protein
MATFDPVPKIGQTYPFFIDDKIDAKSEISATILNIYSFVDSGNKFIYKYDDFAEDVIPIPIMDLWIEEAADLFWILANETDYIIEAHISDLCPQNVYFARTIDGEWHTFETTDKKQFGILDVTGKYHDQAHEDIPE